MNVGAVSFMYMSKEMEPRLESGEASTEGLATDSRTIAQLIKNLVWWAMSQTK